MGHWHDGAPSIARLLIDWSNGDHAALEELTPQVHRELHALAPGAYLLPFSSSPLGRRTPRKSGAAEFVHQRISSCKSAADALEEGTATCCDSGCPESLKVRRNYASACRTQEGFVHQAC